MTIKQILEQLSVYIFSQAYKPIKDTMTTDDQISSAINESKAPKTFHNIGSDWKVVLTYSTL